MSPQRPQCVSVPKQMNRSQVVKQNQVSQLRQNRRLKIISKTCMCVPCLCISESEKAVTCLQKPNRPFFWWSRTWCHTAYISGTGGREKQDVTQHAECKFNSRLKKMVWKTVSPFIFTDIKSSLKQNCLLQTCWYCCCEISDIFKWPKPQRYASYNHMRWRKPQIFTSEKLKPVNFWHL